MFGAINQRKLMISTIATPTALHAFKRIEHVNLLQDWSPAHVKLESIELFYARIEYM